MDRNQQLSLFQEENEYSNLDFGLTINALQHEETLQNPYLLNISSTSSCLHTRKKQSDPSHECEICSKNFYEKEHLAEHLVTTHTDKKHNCDTCNCEFALQEELDTHALTHAKKDLHGSVTCSNESPELKMLANLKIPFVSHTTIDPSFTCHICGNSLSTKRNLIVHKSIHTKKAPYVCRICKHMFFFEIELIKHYKTVHNLEKSFLCDVCDKSFKSRIELTRCKLIHTGERPHTCSVCQKGFITKYELKKHLRIHSKTKP